MKSIIVALLVVATVVSGCSVASSSGGVVVDTTLKPRIVVLTDISTWEPDDSESLVHLLVSADLYEIEAIVYTTGWSHDVIVDEFMDSLLIPHIKAYGKDVSNLMARSSQVGFLEDENVQSVGYWPSLEYLLSRTMFGSKKRGMEFVGEDNHSPGSDYIIELADEEDDRPLWILVWGGGNTLAQSVWKVQQTRDDEGLKSFLGKLRVFTITDQDRLKEDSYDVSSHKWLRSFGKDLTFLWDESAWMAQCKARRFWDKYETMIQPMGHLGKFYPKYVWGVEGDTPTFMYVTPNGLGGVDDPTMLSWGTYFEWSLSPDGETYCYNNAQPADIYEVATPYYNQFYPSMFNNFAARMAWAEYGKGNRNPVVVVDSRANFETVYRTVSVGERCTMDVSESFDPDGDALAFSWWKPVGGSYASAIELDGADSSLCSFTVPSDSMGAEFHIICEVSDSGSPSLTSYKRFVFKVSR
ncbi:MAG: DUF1593 domain-containing protein [Rikenellaceae bacterium]